MASNFGNITVGSTIYEPRADGIYSESTTTFSSPQNEFRIRGGSKRKDGNLTAGVTRVLQKDVTVSGNTTRHQCVVSLSITVPSTGSFSAIEVDDLATDISTFVTPSNVVALLQGKQ